MPGILRVKTRQVSSQLLSCSHQLLNIKQSLHSDYNSRMHALVWDETETDDEKAHTALRVNLLIMCPTTFHVKRSLASALSNTVIDIFATCSTDDLPLAVSARQISAEYAPSYC